jgi:hypothetical protein
MRAAKYANKAEFACQELGNALDDFFREAQHDVAADRYRVLLSNGKKMIASYERLSVQLLHLMQKYDAFTKPPSGPRGPATLHRLVPGKKRKRR